MDALSDVLATMRTGVPAVGRARLATGGWRFAPYDGTGFHIVLQGRCWLLPEKGEPTALGVGDVALFPRGHGHALAAGRTQPPTARQVRNFPQWHRSCTEEPGAGADRSGEGTTVLCGTYRRGAVHPHPLLHELPETVLVPTGMGRNAELRAAVDLLARETQEPRPGETVLVHTLLDAVFVYLVRAWLAEEPTGSVSTGWRQALTDPVCLAALDAIHAAPDHPWTLPELAQRAGVSRATLARRFTTRAGQPPMAYLAWWRMVTAAQLLSTSDATLSEIAARVGYSSPFSLSHAFKREFGRGPHEYRHADGAPGPTQVSDAHP